MADITTIGTFVAAFTWKQFFEKPFSVISSEPRHAWRWNRASECYLIGDLWTLIEEDWHVWIWESGEEGRKAEEESGRR